VGRPPGRKAHYARATERPPFRMTEEHFDAEEAAQQPDPEGWGLPDAGRATT
jgi:NADH-quinone oxidoreductase subunit C/D